jgi:hypothetical protein
MYFNSSILLLLGFAAKFVICDGIFFDKPQLPAVPAIPKILSTESSGSGCPQGTTIFLTQKEGADYLEFMFMNFTAEAGGEAAARVVSKNCEVHISFDAGTPGWQSALGPITVLGSATLEVNATFTAYVTTWWSIDDRYRVSN